LMFLHTLLLCDNAPELPGCYTFFTWLKYEK
jgi:hypothetical protein